LTNQNPKLVNVTVGIIGSIAKNAPEIILQNTQWTHMLFEKGNDLINSAPIFTKLYIAVAWSALFESAGVNKLNCLHLLQNFFTPAVTVLINYIKQKECSDANLT